ncbi:hypothetical protein C8Q79DRAFT_187785 [Trametes meyenii]|nr:hypothetical protein C8Q79DRAFT_187785 [Trametes meyenii]
MIVEPLAVVLAKRTSRNVVKVDPDPEVATGKQEKKSRRKNVGATDSGKKGRPTVMAVTIEDDAAQQISQTSAPRPKKVTKPKATKQAKKGAVDEVKLAKEVTTTTPECQDGPSKAKKPRKKREPKVSSTDDAIPTTSAKGSNAITKSSKPRKKPPTTHKASEAAISGTATAITIQMRVSLSRSSSFKGMKHPPRTSTYPPEHIDALGAVMWDAQGFECMELSALPWIAGVAQHWYATREGLGNGDSQQPTGTPPGAGESDPYR